MDNAKSQTKPRNRFLQLSLKKNGVKQISTQKNIHSEADVIILDDSFDKLRFEFTNIKAAKTYSPVTINDSSEFCEDIPCLNLDKEPSKSGNASFNATLEFTSPVNSKDNRPSTGGWSPAQNILCATPKNDPLPSTPQDKACKSSEQCSIKKIHQSQQKLLSDLYGETWKSIPSLFKTLQQNHKNLNGISKKLNFNDDDKENIKSDLERNKQLYLMESETKRRVEVLNSDKKSKKKLFTEKVPSTPEPPKLKSKLKTTSKKKKSMTVTELVEVMTNDVDSLSQKVKNVCVTPKNDVVNRCTFIGSLADNVPSWRCHTEAMQYRDNYKSLKEKLARRLFVEFNKNVFDNALEADMPIIWDTKLRSTAGTTTNKLIKTSKGTKIRTSSIKLSNKVVDNCQRLRDTLIHELCHAATWLIDGELRAGHGPLWKKWATRSLRQYPELGEISRCHDLEIHYKYCYKCTQCGYSIKRHSKSIDITKKCCGYCRGTFEIIINKKNKDGVVVSTPARKGGPNDFALFVKENYGSHKKNGKTHAEVMKVLGEEFSARKNRMNDRLYDNIDSCSD
ncbi:unnamed protein product [Danaus chrysippus]|uniref:(African queen) hypothetical protein n=1 Tax=Danaus chrysippus TaxID=151541 RepID=A0A8J2W6U1_9NEOP|nr:unnamed protein product [Danaus chrysippus]